IRSKEKPMLHRRKDFLHREPVNRYLRHLLPGRAPSELFPRDASHRPSFRETPNPSAPNLDPCKPSRYALLQPTIARLPSSPEGCSALHRPDPNARPDAECPVGLVLVLTG